MTAFDPTSMLQDSADARCWELLLSGEGGVVLDLLFGEQDDVVAVTRLGLFRSGDRGDHWARIETPPLIQTLHRSGDWWLGTDVGLFRSERLDAVWKPVLARTAITAVAAIDQIGLVLAASVDEGLLRSEDGGVSWEDANPGLPGDNLIAIHQSPQFQHDQMIYVATESGLYRSRNGGRAWRRISLHAEDIQSFCMLNHQLLIGTGEDGLWRSLDAGRTWHQSHSGQSILGFGASKSGAVVVLAETGIVALDACNNDQTQPPLPPDATCAILVGDRTLIGTMGRGVLQRTSDDPGWTSTSAGLVATARDRLRAIGSAHLVTPSGSSTILYSADNGKSWNEVPGAPLGQVSDFDARIGVSHEIEFVACDGQVVAIYRGIWQLIDSADPLAVAWIDGEPAMLTNDGTFVRTDFRSSVFPWRPRLAGAQILPVHGLTDVVWLVLHTVNAGVIVLRSPDGGRRWEPLFQAAQTSAVSLAVTVRTSNKENALAAVDNRIYRVLESPEPLWSGDEGLAISAIAVCPDGHIAIATNRGLYLIAEDFAASRLVTGSPAALLDVDCTTDGTIFVIERGGSVWRWE